MVRPEALSATLEGHSSNARTGRRADRIILLPGTRNFRTGRKTGLRNPRRPEIRTPETRSPEIRIPKIRRTETRSPEARIPDAI